VRYGAPMPILPDHLAPGLRVVFCGTAVGVASAARGHYYAGPGNEFWSALVSAGLIPPGLGPTPDQRVLEFRIGLTDLAKGVAASSDRGLASSYDVEGFVEKVKSFRPAWVAFHGKTAANQVARWRGEPTPVSLGQQTWSVAEAAVFVVPSMSGANRNPRQSEGKSSRQAWFADLADLVGPASPS
jgi:TDG/mug DNA glycosylase family protein